MLRNGSRGMHATRASLWACPICIGKARNAEPVHLSRQWASTGRRRIDRSDRSVRLRVYRPLPPSGYIGIAPSTPSRPSMHRGRSTDVSKSSPESPSTPWGRSTLRAPLHRVPTRFDGRSKSVTICARIGMQSGLLAPNRKSPSTMSQNSTRAQVDILTNGAIMAI